MHPSREPPQLKGCYQCLCKNSAFMYMLLLISNSETVKCLQKVGENLIFLFSPIYFTVGIGRHIVIRIVSAILSHISGISGSLLLQFFLFFSSHACMHVCKRIDAISCMHRCVY